MRRGSEEETERELTRGCDLQEQDFSFRRPGIDSTSRLSINNSNKSISRDDSVRGMSIKSLVVRWMRGTQQFCQPTDIQEVKY